MSAAVAVALAVQEALDCDPALVEIEINPLMLRADGAVAADAFVRKDMT